MRKPVAVRPWSSPQLMKPWRSVRHPGLLTTSSRHSWQMCGLAVFYRSSSEDTYGWGQWGWGGHGKQGCGSGELKALLGLNGHIGFMCMLSLEKEKGFSAKTYCPYTNKFSYCRQWTEQFPQPQHPKPQGTFRKMSTFQTKSDNSSCQDLVAFALVLILCWGTCPQGICLQH